MKKTMIALSMAALFGATSSATAMDFDPSTFYYGAGFGQFDVDFPGADAGSGYQVFVGIPLDLDLGEFKSALEVGFRDAGETDFESCYSYTYWNMVTMSWQTASACDTASYDNGSGLFADFVATYPINDQFGVQGIIGLDFNSKMDMLEYGIGAEYQINDNFGARASYMFKESDEGGLDVTVLGIGVTYRQ